METLRPTCLILFIMLSNEFLLVYKNEVWQLGIDILSK